MAKQFETVRNIKTGNTGWVVCRYNRRSDGKGIVEVMTGLSKNMHWLASNVEAA